MIDTPSPIVDSGQPSSDIDIRNIVSWRVPNEVAHSKSSSPDHSVRSSKSIEKSTNSKSPSRSNSKTHNAFRLKLDLDMEGNESLNIAEIDSSGRVKSAASSLSNSQREAPNTRIFKYLAQAARKAVEDMYDFCDREGEEWMCHEAHDLLTKNADDFNNLSNRMIQQRDFSAHAISSVSWTVKKPTASSVVLPLPQSSLDPTGSADSTVAAEVVKSQLSSHLRASALPFVPRTSIKMDAVNSSRRTPPAVKVPNASEGAPTPFSPRRNKIGILGDAEDDVDYTDIVVKSEVVNASEQVWAEAEAWIDAEFAVEEAADVAWQLMKHFKGGNRNISDTFVFPDVKCYDPSEIRLRDSLITDGSIMCNDTQPRVINPKSPSQGMLRSPSQLSPFRSLHEKLSSPDRHRTRNSSPNEARRKQEARMTNAESNRDNFVAERKLKAMMSSTRRKLVSEKEIQKQAQAERVLDDKLREADKRHCEYLKAIKLKAENENAKVSEVKFINALNAEGVREQLQNKFEEVEARILAATERRQTRLNDISHRQKKKNNRKAQQMTDLRVHLEQIKMERWEKLQAKMQVVASRRENRLAEMSKRGDHESNMSKDDIKEIAVDSMKEEEEEAGAEVPEEADLQFVASDVDGKENVPFAIGEGEGLINATDEKGSSVDVPNIADVNVTPTRRKPKKKSKSGGKATDKELELIEKAIKEEQCKSGNSQELLEHISQAMTALKCCVQQNCAARKKVIAMIPQTEDLSRRKIYLHYSSSNSNMEYLQELTLAASKLFCSSGQKANKLQKAATSVDSVFSTIADCIRENAQSGTMFRSELVDVFLLMLSPAHGILSSAIMFHNSLNNGLMEMVCSNVAHLGQEGTRDRVFETGLCVLLVELGRLLFECMPHLKIHMCSPTGLCSALGRLLQPLASSDLFVDMQQRVVWYMHKLNVGGCALLTPSNSLNVACIARLESYLTAYLRFCARGKDDILDFWNQRKGPQFSHPQGNELFASMVGDIPTLVSTINMLMVTSTTSENRLGSSQFIDLELFLDSITNLCFASPTCFLDIPTNSQNELWRILQIFVDREADDRFSQLLLCKSVILCGFAAIGGKAPLTLVNSLCKLPIKYFTDSRLKSILLPTLLICYSGWVSKDADYTSEVRSLISSELSLRMLRHYGVGLLEEIEAFRTQPQVQDPLLGASSVVLVTHRIPVSVVKNAVDVMN